MHFARWTCGDFGNLFGNTENFLTKMRTGGYNGRRKGGCSLENRGTVRSVAKAMELLQLLSERGEPLSLTEIARLQELPKSTAFGLLNTLRE